MPLRHRSKSSPETIVAWTSLICHGKIVWKLVYISSKQSSATFDCAELDGFAKLELLWRRMPVRSQFLDAFTEFGPDPASQIRIQ